MTRKTRDDTSESETSDSEESSSAGSDSDSSDSTSSESSSSEDSSDTSGSGSSSTDDENQQVAKLLKENGLKKYVKPLSKIKSLKDAKEVDERKLAKLGIESLKDRKRIIRVLVNNGEKVDSSSGDSSEDSASSEESEDEEDQLHQMLRQFQLKKYINYFKRGKINTFAKAYKLDDRKLRKIGILVPSHRKRILSILRRKKEGKDSADEDDEQKIARILRGIEMEEHVNLLQKAKAVDMESAYKLNEEKLKRAGVKGASTRRKIIRAFQKYKETHEDDVDIGSSIVQKLLVKAGMKKYSNLIKKYEIDTVNKAKKLDHKDLRDMGINLYRERRDILDCFEKYDGGDVSSPSSSSDIKEETNPVQEVLRQQLMSRHIPDFNKGGITTIRAARRLTHTQLRSMGVPLYLQREKLINAFKDYKARNKAIMRVLIDTNLAKHANEFEKLLDIEDAKKLTHADLRAMGISLYGQRDRLIKAFAEYQPKKKKKKKKKKKGGSSSESSSTEQDELNPVETILIENKMHRFLQEFKNVKTIKQARALTHEQLRNRGLTLYGQRERLMKAFEEYEKD